MKRIFAVVACALTLSLPPHPAGAHPDTAILCGQQQRTIESLVLEVERAHDDPDVPASVARLQAARRMLADVARPDCAETRRAVALVDPVAVRWLQESGHSQPPMGPQVAAQLASTLTDAAQHETYAALHEAACVAALYDSSRAMANERRRQQTGEVLSGDSTLVNSGRDPWLVDATGQRLAPFEPQLFYNVVQTDALLGGPATYLLGEGPLNDAAARQYVRAAAQLGRSGGAQRLLMVNMAGGQIADFSGPTRTMGQQAGVAASYLEDIQWPDNTLATPEHLLFMALAAADWLRDGPQPAVIAFNCKAGLDRSGMASALTQLIVVHRRIVATGAPAASAAAQTRRLLPRVVAGLKAGRARAISRYARYALVRVALDGYLRSTGSPPG